MRSAAREEEAQGHRSRPPQRPTEPPGAQSPPTARLHAFAPRLCTFILFPQPPGRQAHRVFGRNLASTTECYAQC